MKDLVLSDAFLPSCIDLPPRVRENIVSQLKLFVGDPRNRDLDIEPVVGSKQFLSLRADKTYRIILRRDQSDATLLYVAPADSTATQNVSLKKSLDKGFAPIDALERLLVEEKYLVLTRYLLSLPPTQREAEFAFLELEKLLNAHMPPEARQFPNWWANTKTGKRAHSFAWISAGWIVSKSDIKSHRVTFSRIQA